jgi:hypothetical protein
MEQTKRDAAQQASIQGSVYSFRGGTATKGNKFSMQKDALAMR